MEIGQNNVWFEISVTLTELGLKNWITVSSLIFQYLSDLKKRDVPIHVFNDINQMKRINHDYQQRNTSIVSKYAEMMRNEDIETFPEKSLFIKRFDPDGIKTLINLLVPDSALLTLVSKPLDEDSLQDWLTEKWMGARYYVRSTTSNEFKEFNKSGSNNAQFPAPNRYIPKNLQVLEKTTSTVPLKLHDSENGVVYYNKDNEYLIPRCLLKFRISIPSINASDAKSLALSSLYMSFIDERINEMASEASFAGLNVNVSISDSQKVQVSVSGYSEMINLVLKDVICSVKNPLLGVEEFVVFKDRLERKLINSFKNSPIRQGYEILGDKLMKEYSTSVQILEALKPIDIDMLSLFIKDLYEESYIESFIGGNLTESEALDAWNLVKTTINSKKGNKSLVKKPIVNNLKLNIHSKELDVKGNSLIWVLESTTSGDLKNRIANQLLSRMIKEPFYSELRTRQQCGYIVQSDLFRKHDRLFLITMIQSNTVDPRDLLSRVELFFENFSRELKEDEAMIERFENIKKAMIASKSEPFSTLDENLKHYSDISFEDQDWNVRQETVEILKVYQFEELKEFSNQVLSRMNIQRMGILTTGNDLENVAFRYK